VFVPHFFAHLVGDLFLLLALVGQLLVADRMSDDLLDLADHDVLPGCRCVGRSLLVVLYVSHADIFLPRPVVLATPGRQAGTLARLADAADSWLTVRSRDTGEIMKRANKLIWTGPVFAVVFLLSDLLFQGDAPGEKASSAEVVRYFNGHRGRSLAEVFLAPALVALLILFVSELRRRASERSEHGVGPAVMMSGAVLLGGGALFGAVVQLGAVSASDHHQEQVAQTLSVLNNDDWIPFIGGLAVFLIGAGITVLSSGMLPKWLGWVALVVGIISLAGPGGFAGYFVMPVWIIVAAVILAVRSRSTGTQDASTEHAAQSASV
jgi:Domain of unknown function (DUF4386)